LDIFIDGFANFYLYPYIIYDHLKCVSRLRDTLYFSLLIYRFYSISESSLIQRKRTELDHKSLYFMASSRSQRSA